MQADKVLKVEDGLIALFNADRSNMPQKIEKDESTLSITNYGLLLQVGAIEIPIPETLVNHVIQNGIITLYCGDEESYICEPVRALEINQETLIEARGIMNFQKGGQPHPRKCREPGPIAT